VDLVRRRDRNDVKRLTLRERLYVAVAVLALLVLALGGMLVRWAGFR
jgi:hypothetical protein